jgi:predicted Zn finger-like uncharacterized protein
MYTICPECSTVFVLEAGHLRKAGGLVRCGECQAVFSAVDSLYQDLDEAREALRQKDHDGLQAGEGDRPYAYESIEEMRDEAAAINIETASTQDVEESPPVFEVLDETSNAQSLKSSLAPGHWSESAVSWNDVAGGAGIGLLVLLFGFQWLFFNRAELAADNGWRPALERFCSILQCDLPLQTDVSRIELLNRDVRKHPLVENALLVNATLINHAGFTQTYPVFSIGFSDLSGRLVAARRFGPGEYLGEGADIAAGMAADTPVHVVLEIQDPGKDAVSFQFEFL